MPAQARLLTPEQVHVLAAYVLSLSQGQRVATNP
jgi:cytochrome c oxidase cbb3-type subunit III